MFCPASPNILFMLKIHIAAVSIISLIGINLPVQADDTIYPLPVQNYLAQLAVESDFLRVGDTIKHDHYIINIPTVTLVEMGDATCSQFTLGKLPSDVKGVLKAKSIVELPIVVRSKLGETGVDRFADAVVKSAVSNECPQYTPRLLQP